MKEVLTMTETDLAAALRHCIDDCGLLLAHRLPDPQPDGRTDLYPGRAPGPVPARMTKSAYVDGFCRKAKALSHVEIRRLFHAHPSS